MNKKFYLRFIYLIISIIAISIGCSFYRISGLGGDPVFILNQVLGKIFFNDNVGMGIMLTNILFGIVFVIMNFKAIGLGTILGIFVIGPLTDFILKYIFVFSIEQSAGRFLLFLCGIVIIAIGVSLFVAARLGYAPFEGVMTEISKRTKISIGKIRLIMDISVFTLAMILGAYSLFQNDVVLTLIAIICATFCTGPLVDIIYKRINIYVKE